MDKASIVEKMIEFDEFFVVYTEKNKNVQAQGTLAWREDPYILKELAKSGMKDKISEPDDKAILFWNRTTNSFKCLSIYTIKAVKSLNSVLDTATPL